MAASLLLSRNGVDLDVLDTIASTAPLSSSARIRAAMSIIMRQTENDKSPERATVIVRSLEALHRTVIGLAAPNAHLADAWMWRALSAAAGLAQLRAAPMPYYERGGAIDEPPFIPEHIVADTEFDFGLACPVYASNSCFIDTLLVMMFGAVQLFDAPFWATRNAYDGLPTSKVLQDSTTEYKACDPDEGSEEDARQALLADVRLIVNAMRLGGDPASITATIIALRRNIGKCSMLGETGQEDIGNLYDVLMSRTTYGMHYVAPVTLTLKMLTEISSFGEVVALNAPFVYGAEATSTTGSPLKITAPRGTLQESIDASLWVENTTPGVVRLDGGRLAEHAVEYEDEALQILTRGFSGVVEIVGQHRVDVTHLVNVPASGVLPLYYAVDPLSERDIDLGPERRFTVTTMDGKQHRYEVFAVAVWMGRRPRSDGSISGHYWCHFWRRGDMFYYNDSTPASQGPTLQRIRPDEIPPVDNRLTAEQEIRRHGVLYFSFRVHD